MSKKTFLIEWDDEHKKMLQRYAKERGMTLAGLINVAIRQYQANNK
jgi:hypothetical protein